MSERWMEQLLAALAHRVARDGELLGKIADRRQLAAGIVPQLVKAPLRVAERVLDGGTATIDRFRPTLVVELNPITIRRMQHGEPRDLYRRLLSIYGRLHLAAISDDGPMTPVLSWGQVERMLAESGLCNLVCSPRRLVPGSRGMAGRAAAVRRVCGLTLRRNRFVTPRWAAIHQPRVTIRADLIRTGVPVLRGVAGKRVNVPLRITCLIEVSRI